MVSPTPLSIHTPTSGTAGGTASLVSQARNIVLNVFQYFDKDKKEPVEAVLKKAYGNVIIDI